MILRQTQILHSLRTKGHCTVDELCRQFDVSDMTIRRDLQSLENSGHILRTHGGATMAERVAFEFGFMQRGMENREAKRAIAAAAFSLLGHAKSILLDSGTTTLALADSLRACRGITVITTSLPIASALQFSEGVDLLLLGGLLRRESPDLIGGITESNLENLHADIAFIGADAVDETGGAYNQSLPVARMLQKMTAATESFYVVADSSKLGRKAMVRFGELRQAAGLITDAGISPAMHESLKNAGVNLIIASPLPSESERNHS